MSYKSPARVSYKSVPQECPVRVFHKSVSHKSVPEECPTRVSYKSVIWTYVAFRTCLHSGSWAPSCLCNNEYISVLSFEVLKQHSRWRNKCHQGRNLFKELARAKKTVSQKDCLLSIIKTNTLKYKKIKINTPEYLQYTQTLRQSRWRNACRISSS